MRYVSDFSFELSFLKAINVDDIKVLRFLLKINTNPNAADDNGVIALCTASQLS